MTTIQYSDYAIEAIIEELGNGIPGEGAYVPGTDGELYYVDGIDGQIQTGRGGAGCAKWVRAHVTQVDWDDVEESEIFRAQVIVNDGEVR